MVWFAYQHRQTFAGLGMCFLGLAIFGLSWRFFLHPSDFQLAFHAAYSRWARGRPTESVRRHLRLAFWVVGVPLSLIAVIGGLLGMAGYLGQP